jgi:hypothetical protein
VAGHSDLRVALQRFSEQRCTFSAITWGGAIKSIIAWKRRISVCSRWSGKLGPGRANLPNEERLAVTKAPASVAESTSAEATSLTEGAASAEAASSAKTADVPRSARRRRCDRRRTGDMRYSRDRHRMRRGSW